MIAYLKRGTVVVLSIAFIALTVLGIKYLNQRFVLQDIEITGNYQLDKDYVTKLTGVNIGDLMLELDLETVDERLTDNPWIKSVSMRKQLPDRLLIKINEATPTALLGLKKRLYLIDRDGEVLERIKEENTHFLPVIKGINPKNKKAMSEALKLVAAISEKKTFSDRESIEIGHESYGLTMKVDGEFIKVGYGDYAQKFARWIALEPEIRKKGVPVKYVDLRFKDSVIIKPVKTKKRKRTS